MADTFQKRSGNGMKENSEFYLNVVRTIKKIPKGKVATYGQIAKIAGKPQGSRGVGWILHSSSSARQLPWQRVINSQGKISFPKGTENFKLQRKLLLEEGIDVSTTGRVSLAQFLWNKAPSKPKKKRNTPSMFD